MYRVISDFFPENYYACHWSNVFVSNKVMSQKIMFNKEAMFLNDFELIYELSRYAGRLFKGIRNEFTGNRAVYNGWYTVWNAQENIQLNYLLNTSQIKFAKPKEKKIQKKKCQDRDAVSQRKRQKGKKCGEIFPFKARDERQKCKINIKELYKKKVVFR